ncbi:hypothetical protein [Actinomadura rubrisoli]|uniref:Uncharacterized protein n=1 Tax=Actinomadura rubrisoli TaxID=2530368 RepID=A0A4R5CJM2_9ACTN|nr:hypothetical protein [Actinomadura rubrisoli]TDD97612.1 hypothetical protein E1298_00855 [Actinomadura rubrisoli]
MTNTDDGMHDCARGERCAARKTIAGDGGERIIVPAQTYRVFCDGDRDRVRVCVAELPNRYTELRTRIGDRRIVDGPRVSGGGRSAPVPINLGVDALLRQIEEITLSWDERVRVLARLADLTAPSHAHAVTAACGMLTAHVDVLLGLDADDMTRTMDLTRREYLPDDATGWVFPAGGWILYYAALGAAEAGREVLNLHHRSLAMLGYAPQHHDLIVACWECGERSLRRHDGTAGLADHVECLRCREQYLGSRLRSLMVEEEQAQLRKAGRERRRTDPGRVVLAGSRDGTGGRA